MSVTTEGFVIWINGHIKIRTYTEILLEAVTKQIRKTSEGGPKYLQRSARLV